MKSIHIGTLLLGLTALPLASGANTGKPWGNPLLKGVPNAAFGFASVDLSGSQQPLSSILPLLAQAGGGEISGVITGWMKELKLPDELSSALGKDGDRRLVVFAELQGKGPGVGVLYGLKSSAAVKAALKGAPDGTTAGVPYHKFDEMFVTVRGSTLIVANVPEALADAAHQLDAGAPFPIGKWKSKLGEIEPDAEIVAMVGGSDSANIHLGAGNLSDLNVAASLGLHRNGVSLCMGPVKLSGGTMPNFSSFAPLPANYLSTMPGGAYAVVGLASLGKILSGFPIGASVGSQPALVRQSLTSLLNSDVMVGLYPSTLKGGKPEGLDLLAEVRPRSGGNPGLGMIGAMKTALAGMIPHAMGSLFQPFKIDGADHAYRLNPKLLSLAKIGLKGMMESSGVQLDSLTKSKTLEFAMVGRSVLMATNDTVLRKAVGAYKYGSSALIFDPKFHELAVDAKKPTQMVLAVSLSRVIQFGSGLYQGILSTGGGKKLNVPDNLPLGMVSSMLNNWPDPLLLRFSSTPAGLSARVFVPIDFDMISMFAGSIPKGNR